MAVAMCPLPQPACEPFASHHGADFYGLPRNTQRITLRRESWTPPERFAFGDAELKPLRAGEALADADKALQRYLSLPQQPGQPSYADAHWRRGMIAERRNNVADARSAYRQALEVNPQHAASLQALARLAGQQEDDRSE
mgnify:CR=1 FL=1